MNSENPFFTIIIPTFNRKNEIGRAIESVVNQEFKDWELLIIDDGSTDETGLYISSSFGDDRIKYFYKTHEERSVARNYGIDRANGQYICFLDSDDEYLENFLQLHFDAIHLYPEFKMFRVGTILIKDETEQKLGFPVLTLNSFENVCMNFNGFCSYVFHSEIFYKFKFDTRFPVAQDFHLVIRIVKKYHLKFVNEYGFIMHYNQESELINSNYLFRMKLKIDCLNDIINVTELNGNEKNLIKSRICIVYGIIISSLLKHRTVNYINISLKGMIYLIYNLKIAIGTFYSIKNQSLPK